MKYERLARSRRGLGKWYSLWLGDDHLLAVESTGYSEEYKRYYLKDIQAVVTRRSAWGNVVNALCGLLLALSLFAVYAGYNGGPTPEAFIAGVFAGLFLILLLWNLFRGPTCRCHVRLPLGIEEFEALDRLRNVKKVLTRLQPLIGQLQGGISRKDVTALARAAKDAPSFAATAVTASMVAGIPHEIENAGSDYRGGFHIIAFSLLIADSFVSLYQIYHSPKFLGHVSTGLSILFLIFAIIALVNQATHSLPSLAKWMMWGGIATVPAGMISGIVFAVYFQFDNLQRGIHTQISAFDLATLAAAHPVFAMNLLVYALLEAGIGITGLIALVRKVHSMERYRP